MKIAKRPVSLKDKFVQRAITTRAKRTPFAHVPRGENAAFDTFMNQADSMISDEKQILKETELFNKALLKDKKLMALSKKLTDIPVTPKQIAEYKKVSNKLLSVAEKCGASHLYKNMKISFDLMLETGKNLNLRINS